MNRGSTPSNIAEVLPSSAAFHVRPPNVQSSPALFRDFRVEPWINVSGNGLFFSAHVDDVSMERASLSVHNSGFIMTEPHERFSVIGFQRKRRTRCGPSEVSTPQRTRHLDRSSVPRILCLLTCWRIRTLRCAPRT